MNVTFQYTTPDDMYNGNKNSGVIGDLTSGFADISLNADSLALFLVNETLDVTEPIELNDMCILVPKAGTAPIIWNLLRTLSRDTWLVTLLSIVFMVLIIKLGQAVNKMIYSPVYPFYEYTWNRTSMVTFQSFFGDAIRKIPTAAPMRILIICWCISSFLITNAFQAKLISSLVLPRALDDIETVEQLGRSSLQVVYPKALANHINEYTNNQTKNALRDHFLEVETEGKLNELVFNKSATAAFVMMRFQADLVEKRTVDKATGKPFYKTMKECLLTFPRVYFLKLGSMYVDYVSELVRRFHETGFIAKWNGQAEFINALHGNVVAEEIDVEDVDDGSVQVVISTQHLQTSFYLLLVGLFIAAMTFIIENIHFRRNRPDPSE